MSSKEVLRIYVTWQRLFLPESFSDVFGMAVGVTVKPLVGGAGVQSAEIRTVTADLDVIEEVCITGDDIVARIPCHLQLRVLTQMLGQGCHILRLTVAAHETDTGDLLPIFA